MKISRIVPICVALTAAAAELSAQQPAGSPQPLRSTPVLTQPLADSAFTGVVVSSSVLDLAPGARAAQPHRHDAELFGYILSGAVLTSLEDGPLQRYDAGEMFYERRNILHSRFENASAEQPARVLILMIAKPPVPER